MQAIDPSRHPTRFQRHVLNVLRAVGPCSLAELRVHCVRPGVAVRQAVWILTSGGFAVRRRRNSYDITAAGRTFLALSRDRARSVTARVTPPAE